LNEFNNYEDPLGLYNPDIINEGWEESKSDPLFKNLRQNTKTFKPKKLPLLIVVGPSGVGKKMDRRWMEHEYPEIFGHVPSFTTRVPRPYETPGIDYK